MERPVCYDVTRLLTRVLNATPNGIDRVDFALASHFLNGPPERTFGLTATGFGARLLGGPAAAEAVNGIGTHWGESDDEPSRDPVFQRVAAFLQGSAAHGAMAEVRKRPRRLRPPRADLRGIAGWIGRHGLPVTRRPAAQLPPKSIYLNSSQFPLWVARSFDWLAARRDVRGVFFLHDLLPIFLPEYFRKAEEARHHRRLENFARFGAAALVTTKSVAADLEAHLAKLGRKDCPIFVAPTPLAPVFSSERTIDPALQHHPFFVLCSTLEPRKNHLMILAVWRALVDRLGDEAPKLVLVGTRGWHYGAIVDLVERSPRLRRHVIEVGGLSTPGLKRLIDNARAVLMPSFGEGFGLPVHEALAAGAPVVASDIPVFREIEDGDLTLLSPLDGEAWLETIAAMATTARNPGRPARPDAVKWSGYFERLDAFLAAL